MKLYNADSYQFINTLQGGGGIKVDAIITDPPYNISQPNNFSTMKTVRVGIDFGEWDRGVFDLFSWITPYCQLLNDNGCAIIFCSYRYISRIIETLEISGLIVKDVIVWQKTNPMPRNIERRYVQDMEFAVWAVKKGAKWTFNKPKGVPYLRSLYKTSLVSGKEKLGHPTQKSLSLMKELVRVHTNPGDVVLDPFMGSGTTGEACALLDRDFIGIEKDKGYFDMANYRLFKFIK